MKLKNALIGVMIVPTLILAGACSNSQEKSGNKDATEQVEKKPVVLPPDLKDKTPKAIVDEALVAMKTLKTVNFKGTYSNSENATAEFDFTVADDKCAGELSSTSFDNGTLRLLVFGDKTYMKGDKAFWRASAGEDQANKLLDLVKDKWILGSPDSTSQFAAFCDIDTFVGNFASGNQGGVYEVDFTSDEVDGVKAVAVKDKVGGATGWIAYAKPHYLVKFENAAGTVRFSKFDEPFAHEEPTPDQTFKQEVLKP